MREDEKPSMETREEIAHRKMAALDSLCGILKGNKMTLEQAREERLARQGYRKDDAAVGANEAGAADLVDLKSLEGIIPDTGQTKESAREERLREKYGLVDEQKGSEE